MSTSFIAIAKSFVRFEVALCRHSGVRRNPVFSIPRHAGLDPGFRRGDGSRERHYFWQLLYNGEFKSYLANDEPMEGTSVVDNCTLVPGAQAGSRK